MFQPILFASQIKLFSTQVNQAAQYNYWRKHLNGGEHFLPLSPKQQPDTTRGSRQELLKWRVDWICIKVNNLFHGKQNKDQAWKVSSVKQVLQGWDVLFGLFLRCVSCLCGNSKLKMEQKPGRRHTEQITK